MGPSQPPTPPAPRTRFPAAPDQPAPVRAQIRAVEAVGVHRQKTRHRLQELQPILLWPAPLELDTPATENFEGPVNQRKGKRLSRHGARKLTRRARRYHDARKPVVLFLVSYA